MKKSSISLNTKSRIESLTRLFKLLFEIALYSLKYSISLFLVFLTLISIPLSYWYITFTTSILAFIVLAFTSKAISNISSGLLFNILQYILKSSILFFVLLLLHPLLYLLTETNLVNKTYLVIGCVILVVISIRYCPKKDNRFTTGYKNNPSHAKVKYIVFSLIQLLAGIVFVILYLGFIGTIPHSS